MLAPGKNGDEHLAQIPPATTSAAFGEGRGLGITALSLGVGNEGICCDGFDAGASTSLKSKER